MTDLTRTVEDGRYELTGPAGTLTYTPPRIGQRLTDATLSADGDLPPWTVAAGYALDCARAHQNGAEALWAELEVLYAAATETGGPDGCALCGVVERQHAQHFFAGHQGADRKGWVAPDDQTRLARMRARRAARTTA
ncbi:hypothetical protein [Catenuloplanes japonicus]|uniref:hypothetical protein n=1 Tax=Catenuloplanes japonicus TaxID=33876 RepID=UPI000524D83D|nr:hypothetical protein [Catenuloplanes japonicus]